MRFLFVDRILDLTPGKITRGLKHVTHDDYYLTHAENGRLCFIPSLIGETLGQLAAWNVMVSNNFSLRPVAGIVASAHLLRPVYVGETLLLESVIDSLDDTAVRYHSVAYVGDEEVFRIDNALGPLLPMQDFIDGSTIRRQFAEIDHPGEAPIFEKSTISDALNNSVHEPQIRMSFDRVSDFSPNRYIVAEKTVNPAAPYLPDHFPDKPVLPMTVLLECTLNLAHDFLSQSQLGKFEVREMRRIKMNTFVLPGDVLQCHLRVKSHDEETLVLSCRSEVDGKRVCVLDIVMTAKG